MALFGKKTTEEKKHPDNSADVAFAETKSPSMPTGGDAKSYGLILGSHITEKASNSAGLNKYIFKIAKHANKLEVRKAIEKMYKVNVTKINVQNMPSKTRRYGRTIGHVSGFRKAIVTVQEGQKIETV